jgi:formyl-CoA transferase
MSLFGAIMLGLYQREKTGRGGKVGTSLMASGAWANACDLQARFCNAVFPQVVPGGAPPNPLAAGYTSRDGKAFLLIQLDPDHEFPRLCEALGFPDVATTEMFSSNAARTENRDELYALLQSQFEARELAELRTLFKKFDIKWAPLPKLEDVAGDPQMRHAKAVVEIEHPSHGKLETVNSPVFVAGSEKRKPTLAPEIGAHTREVLRELGYSPDAIETLIRSGAATAVK